MDQVTVSSKGQVAIPKAIREKLNLAAGTKLSIEVRGQELVLAKDAAWKRLRGAAAGSDLMEFFSAFKRRERERENSGT